MTQQKRNPYILVGLGSLLIVGFLVGALVYRNQAAPADAATDNPAAADAEIPQELRARLVRDDSPTQGPSLAKVTIVEFLDPECESCRAMHPIVKRIQSDFAGKIRLVVRYMPFHTNSVYAATALEAAGRQGKYWEALELLFEHQPEWGSHHEPKPQLIPGYLKTLGLDMARFEQDLKDPALAAKIERDKQDGIFLGVRATPSLFVNGRPLLELGYGPLRELLIEELDR